MGPSPILVSADSTLEHEVQVQLQKKLKFKMRYSRPRVPVLVCWATLDAAGDTWEPT